METASAHGHGRISSAVRAVQLNIHSPAYGPEYHLCGGPLAYGMIGVSVEEDRCGMVMR